MFAVIVNKLEISRETETLKSIPNGNFGTENIYLKLKIAEWA